MTTRNALFLCLTKYCTHTALRKVLLSTGADTIEIIRSKCKTVQKKHDQTEMRLLGSKWILYIMAGIMASSLWHILKDNFFLFLLLHYSSENPHIKFAKTFLQAAGKIQTETTFSYISKYNFLERSLIAERLKWK